MILSPKYNKRKSWVAFDRVEHFSAFASKVPKTVYIEQFWFFFEDEKCLNVLCWFQQKMIDANIGHVSYFSNRKHRNQLIGISLFQAAFVSSSLNHFQVSTGEPTAIKLLAWAIKRNDFNETEKNYVIIYLLPLYYGYMLLPKTRNFQFYLCIAQRFSLSLTLLNNNNKNKQSQKAQNIYIYLYIKKHDAIYSF